MGYIPPHDNLTCEVCMSELFDDEEDKVLVSDDELLDIEDVMEDITPLPTMDARRRLESLLDEKRLRKDLDDLFDSY